MPSKSDNLSERFAKTISRSAQFLCHSHDNCSWGATKTSGMTIWALYECGLTNTNKDFLIHSLDELVSKEGKKSDKGLSFDSEIWETSVALIALCKTAPIEFNKQIRLIKKWLLSQISEDNKDNFKNEPWETMWAVMALFESGGNNVETEQLIKRCISWVLDKRNIEGILISLHYMGFLLTVLNYAIRYGNFDDVDKKEYQEARTKCEEYIEKEFYKNRANGLLWSNEPWSIGHILVGIAESPLLRGKFFNDKDFNEYLLNWYEKEWKPKVGWGGIKETCDTLVGLMKYYHNREVDLNYGKSLVGLEAVQNISNRIDFKYEDVSSKKMEVFPLWHARGIKRKDKEVFLLMPFKENWSEGVYKEIEKFLDEEGLHASRADKEWSPEAIEKIWKSINAAQFLIADITNDTPNVLYELGIAHTIGKKVIIITQNINKIPFNLKISDVIEYNYTTWDGKQQLKEGILRGIDKVFRRK